MKEDVPFPPGEGKVKWINTDWLEENLEDEDLMILDVQPNVHDYIKEHIPGAVYMNEGLFRVPKRGTPAFYVDPESIQINFRRIGLEKGTPVVIYTGTGPFKKWGDGLEQTMATYTLARFGHENIYVLDGGIDKWKKEDKSLTKTFPEIEKSNFEVDVQENYFLKYEEFKVMKDESSTILLDARPANVYEGQGPWQKPGHIPGAINLPWANLMDEDNKRLLKPKDEIESIIEDIGIDGDKTVICSCGTGREATNEFILFKWFLEYSDVKIYEGSFTEWSSIPDNPTVTGENPR